VGGSSDRTALQRIHGCDRIAFAVLAGHHRQARKKIALALHGSWMAPARGFDDPDVMLLFGINPLVTFTGFPYGNPGKWLGNGWTVA